MTSGSGSEGEGKEGMDMERKSILVRTLVCFRVLYSIKSRSVVSRLLNGERSRKGGAEKTRRRIGKVNSCV